MNNVTLSLIIIISFFVQNQFSKAQCHIDDWTALKALYESTDGDNWTNRIGWDVQIANQSTPPANCDLGELFGVDLDITGRVYQLILSSNQLNGNIPSELSNLSNLWQMSMNNNQLKGSLPTELSGLNNLTGLWLANNQLNGSISAEIGNLNSLITLLLSGNQLTGNIPPELGNLTNLGALILSSNQLSGSIPSELGNLTDLTQLALDGNHLSGCYPDNLSSLCTQLSTQDFGNNFAATWEDFCNTTAGICNLSETYNIIVPTNYSGYVEVAATLSNNNQYSLQNNASIVYDYSTCTDYSNLQNCNPVVGFDNLAANEAFWAASKASEYFSIHHNIQLPSVNIIVNNTERLNSAYFNPPSSTIVLGKGDGLEKNSMTAPDIVGHEYTHFVIDSLSQLDNYGEFGALQESFADIFGEMIEHYCYGTNDWIFASQVITPTAGYTGIRNLANPLDADMKNPQPAFYESENYWIVQNEDCYFDDLCGIHINSGVQNYWFYLLSEGGSDINENGDTYSITGIGKEKVAQITFENLNNISTNTETVEPHYQAMYGAIQEAQILYGENADESIQTSNAWQAVGLYKNQINPIKWKIANQQRDFNRPEIQNGDTTFIPMLFDLVIDSLEQELTADALSINLQLPSQLNMNYITALTPLLQSELTVEPEVGETNILINRQANQAAKLGLAPKIQSGTPILRAGVCIITIDIAGEDLNLAIDISGGTESNTFVQFKPDKLSLGSNNNNLNADSNYLLNLSIGFNQKTCSALGWLDINILNGSSSFRYTLKNSFDMIVEEVIKNEVQHQFYNLVEDNYELYIQEEDGQRNITKNFTISHYADINGSECCPENLIIPAGQFSGLFTASEYITIKQGSTFNLGNISICNE